ncbi:MAG TPA: methyltransferase domain-containing protein [Planctomycetota bacterium]|nr:methyltransferase domain-containing protein [Planctomycetota bacterium]
MNGANSSLNEFGPNFPLDRFEDMAARLGLKPGDRVLEVGGGGNPFPAAQVVCDLTFGSSAQRNGAPACLRSDRTYVEAPVEELPFGDGEFDFVYCTQVLEHVKDPESACGELARVARRGFVEMPSRLGELTNGNPTHRWIVDLVDGVLQFTPRPFIEHPLHHFFYGLMFRDGKYRELSEGPYRNLFNIQLLFEGALPCRVLPRRETDFDYDRPDHAFRAHYDFALRTLSEGAPASYAYGDALEALRLLPTAFETRWLQAAYLTHLYQYEEAERILQSCPEPAAKDLSAIVRKYASGLATDLRAFPLPRSRPGLPASGPAERPLVSILVAADTDEDLRVSAESAVTQDYPAVEVLVASPGSREALQHLRDFSRVRHIETGAGATLGERLNRAAQASRGSLIAFAIRGDRLCLHHLDRLTSLLPLAQKPAALSGSLDLATGDVRLPLHSGEQSGPTPMPLSCLVAAREHLFVLGGIREQDDADSAERDYLSRILRESPPTLVQEGTVISGRTLGSPLERLRDARAAAHLDPVALLRELMAAHAREAALLDRKPGS